MNNLFNTITILFLLIANFAFGQVFCNDNTYTLVPIDGTYHIRQPIDDVCGDNDTNWTREDFIKNGINTISAYSYCFDRNLNVEDSFFTSSIALCGDGRFGSRVSAS